MSRPHAPRSTKLVVGLLFCETDLQQQALKALCEHFGPMDFLTEPESFTYTNYYDSEMGQGINRQVCSFVELVRSDTLPEIKLFTNQLEIQFSSEGRRRVNIDPGLLSEERVVLATGKNFTHRIYLRDGIYADLTLIYQRGGYQTLPWTYPSYREPGLLRFLGALRQKLIFQRTGRLPRKPAPTGGPI